MKHPFYDLALLIDLKIKCKSTIFEGKCIDISILESFRHSASNWNSWTRDCQV